MIRVLFILIVFGFVTQQNAYGNTTRVDNPPHIQLQINGFKNDYVKLIAFYGEQRYTADSAMADETGKAIFQKDSAYLTGMYFIQFPDKKNVQMLIDREQQFSMSFDKENPVGTMIVSNSLDNELLYKNLKYEATITPKFDSIQRVLDKLNKDDVAYIQTEKEKEKILALRKAHIQWFADHYPNAFFTRFKILGQNAEIKFPKLPDGSIDIPLQTYYFLNDYWKDYDFTDERMLYTAVYYNKLKKYIALVPQNLDSLIKYGDAVIDLSKANKKMFEFTAIWIAMQYVQPKTMGLEAYYVHVIEKYWTYDQITWEEPYEVDRLRAQVKLIKTSLLGNTAQDVKGINEYDKPVSIYDIKAPFTVVYLFSYDCGKCKKETPNLVAFYNEWKDKGVEVFTICMDGDTSAWKQYLLKNNMSFHNIFDPMNTTDFLSKYYVDITPEIYVLNKDHKIIGNNINSSQIPSVIEHELSK